MTDIAEMSLAEACEALHNEPLLSMSLGSKELFHSNFLVWFAQQFPAAAREAFRSWTYPSEQIHTKGHERESAHLDAVLRFDGLLPIVIENKVFSVPDPAQLDGYLGKFDAELQAASHILLTLMDPGLVPKEWRARRYAELADSMEGQFVPADELDFRTQVVRHYISFIRLLQLVMDTVGQPSGRDSLQLPEHQARLLAGIRMDAAVQKARASWVAAEIRRQMGKALGEVHISSGFTNGHALVEGFCRVPDTEVAGKEASRQDLIGWQLQADQFRLAVITYKFPQRSLAARHEREKYVHNMYSDWFSLDRYVAVTSRKDALAATRRRGGEDTLFQGYDPTFSYRYVQCGDLTVDEIVRVGIAYSRAANEHANH